MTTWARGVCATNGIDLAYLRTGGSGPPVVLLHGLMGAGHGLPFEQPEGLAEVTRAFLRQC